MHTARAIALQPHACLSPAAHLAHIWLVPQGAEEGVGVTQAVLGNDVGVCDEAVALQPAAAQGLV